MKLLISLLTLLCISTAHAVVTFDEFQELRISVQSAFQKISSSNENLQINLAVPDSDNFWWKLDDVYASYVRFEENDSAIFHRIYIFGGMARLKEMTPDGLAIVMCHEIAHGIGGAPFKNKGPSAEGQSDYFSTNVCLKEVFNYLPISNNYNPTVYLEFCKQAEDFTYCLRAMKALESSVAFYKYLGTEVSIQDFSIEVATQINTDDQYYPSAQCRLDTSILGILGKERPSCWYPGGTTRY